MEEKVKITEIEDIFSLAMTYNYSTTQLIEIAAQNNIIHSHNGEKIGREFINRELLKRGFDFKWRDCLRSWKRFGINLLEIKEVADYYIDNNCSTLAEAIHKFPNHKITIKNLKVYLIHIGKYKVETIDSRNRKYKSSHEKKIRDNSKKIWCDAVGKSILRHHKVWYDNTGYIPDYKNKEQIHHIDCDNNNNDFNNLFLTTVDEHTRIHKEYERVTAELIKSGLISFDKDKRGIDWQTVYNLILKSQK